MVNYFLKFSAMEISLLMILFFFCITVTVILILKNIRGDLRLPNGIVIKGKNSGTENGNGEKKKLYMEKLTSQVREEEQLKSELKISFIKEIDQTLNKVKIHSYSIYLDFLKTISSNPDKMTFEYKKYYESLEQWIKGVFDQKINIELLDYSNIKCIEILADIKKEILNYLLEQAKGFSNKIINDLELIKTDLKGMGGFEHDETSEMWIYLSTQIDDFHMQIYSLVTEYKEKINKCKQEQKEVLNALNIKST